MPHTETEEALSRVPFFAGLSRRDLRRLAALCVPKTFETGAVMLREGAVGLGLYLISDGRVEVFKTENGRRRKLAELAAGDVLGEMALIDEKPRSASAVALEPTSALLLSRDSFRIVVKKSPAVAWALVPELAGRLREVEDRLVEAEGRAEKAGAEATEAAEAGAAGEAETPAADHDDVEEPSSSSIDGGLPKALLASAMKGLGGPWQVFKQSSRAFTDAMDLDSERETLQLLTRLPRGALAAAASSVTETGRVAQDMMSTFVAHLGCDDDRDRGSDG